MEYVEGTDLSQIWFDPKEHEIISLMGQLARLESTTVSISFPAGGSIYYARDLKELSGNEGILLDEQAESMSLEKERFCIGPDVSVPLWYGRREQLDIFRGPCTFSTLHSSFTPLHSILIINRALHRYRHRVCS